MLDTNPEEDEGVDEGEGNNATESLVEEDEMVEECGGTNVEVVQGDEIIHSNCSQQDYSYCELNVDAFISLIKPSL